MYERDARTSGAHEDKKKMSGLNIKVKEFHKGHGLQILAIGIIKNNNL